MRRSAFLLVVGAAFLAVLCSCVTEPPVEPGSEPTSEPVIAPNALVLEEMEGLTITGVTDDQVTLTFTGSVPMVSRGGYVISSACVEGYYGFLRRVEDYSVSGNTMTITTSEARLTDVIEQCDVDTTYQLTLTDGPSGAFTCVESLDGVTASDFGIDLSGVVLYDGEIGGAHLLIEIPHGYIGFEPGIDIGIDIEDWEIVEFHAIASGDVFFDCDLQASLTGDINYSRDTTLATYSWTFTQWVGWIPIVEVVELSFVAGFDVVGSSENIITTGFDHSAHTAAGAQYYYGEWSTIWERTVEQNAHPTTWSSTSDIDVRGYVIPRVSVLFYGIAGPYIEVEPYLGIRGEFNAGGGSRGASAALMEMLDGYRYWWELYAGITGRLGFEVTILSWELVDYYVDLFDWRWIIAEGEGGGGGVEPPLTCLDIQGEAETSPYLGQEVCVTGVVTGGGNDYTAGPVAVMADQAGGPWTGLFLHGSNVASLERGDSIVVSGTVCETDGMTGLDDIMSVEVVTGDVQLPDPMQVRTDDIAPGSDPERFEGVLLTLADAFVTEAGEYQPTYVDDGSGPGRIGDRGYYSWSPEVGDTVHTATGVLFEGSEWRLEPRGNDDLDISEYSSGGGGGGGGGPETYPDSIAGTIPTGIDPYDVCVLPAGDYAYVSRNNSDRVSILRLSDMSYQGMITVGDEPRGICPGVSGNFVYVANHDAGSVSVINTTTNTIYSTVSVGGNPTDLCATQDGGHIYVTRSESGDVAVMRTSDHSVIASVDVGDSPCAVATAGNYAFVANYGSNNVSVIRTTDHCMIRTIAVGSQPFSVCASPDGDYVYVVRSGTDRVSVIRVSDFTVVESVSVGQDPRGICALGSGGYVYVTSCLTDRIWVIETEDNSIIATIGVGDYPWSIASAPDGSAIYVVNHRDDNVTVLR